VKRAARQPVASPCQRPQRRHHPNVTSSGAESYEALKGFGPSLLSVLDAMRRSREHRVRTTGTKGGRNPRRRRRRKRHSSGPVAAVAGRVVAEGAQEVHAAEFGPVDLGEPDFGVGALPEQEAGEALFAGG